MKSNIVRYVFVIFILFSIGSCKKFLNVNPMNSLSGNNFWKDKSDVEKYTKSIYNQFRSITSITSAYNIIGDLRCGIYNRYAYSRDYIDYFANNDLKSILTSNDWWSGDNYGFGFKRIPNWKPWMQMIESANTLYENIDNVPTGKLSPSEINTYKAEAVFLRCLAYFYISRLYGDVPYSIQAYNTSPLPRTKMIVVLHNCYDDLSAHLNNLPWTYEDPANVGVRAMKGAALDLLMNIDMWCVNFDDDSKKSSYYDQVDSLGNVLLNQNGGVYGLMPMEDFKQIFKGHTKENLFEIPQNYNYGESFSLAGSFSDLVLHQPEKPGATMSYMYPNKKLLQLLYPDGQTDLRKSYWFRPTTMYATDGTFEFLKFVNIFAQEGENANPDDDYTLFRLPDAILLRAEACVELGKIDDAVDLLNMIRSRAHATLYDKALVNDKDYNLKDAIYFERAKELMGEGYNFYDLVRTKRIIDSKFCAHPLSYEQYINGAWTWPIDNSALTNNPYMVLNTYWN